MTRYFLTRLKIEGFRGINNETDPLDLRFRPDAVNSVFAVNGVGKTSIFEALSYAICGCVAKLDNLQSQERPQDYICNRFHSKRTGTIELELTPDDGTTAISICVERDSSGQRTVTSPSGHPDPSGLLATLNQDFTLLDYQRFTRFIDSTPLDRGRSFSALLGLSSYSDFRQVLQTVSDTRTLNADLELNTLRAQVKGAQEAVQREQRQWIAAYHGVTGKQAVDTGNLSQYVADVLAALVGIDLIKAHVTGKMLQELDFPAIKKQVKEAEGGELRKQLEAVIAKITKLDRLGDPDPANAIESTKILKLIKEKNELLQSTRGSLFQKLHQSAKTLIDAGEWEEAHKCPLCESTLSAEIGVLVQAQLDRYTQVAAKTELIKTTWQTSDWSRRLALLEQTDVLGIPVNERVTNILAQKANTGTFTEGEITKAVETLKSLESKRTAELTSAKKVKGDLESKLPPSLVQLTEQLEYARQFREALFEHVTKKRGFLEASEKLKIRERWQKFISNAATVFGKAEAELSQNQITAIDNEYKSMFGGIMAAQDVVPNLERADRSEDLHVQLSDFHGIKDVSARALLSESFRNALAISVFLSAALKHSGVPRFVVLDDVTSIFDSGHQWNLMEAIRQGLQQPTNPDGLQFIILSHDGLLEKYFDKLGNTADWHHQKLQGWPPLGAVMTQSQDANRLRKTADKFLDAGQVKEAEPLIRQYLEFKLLQIINKCRIHVPLDFAIKDHLKMVSNCLDAIQEAIGLHTLAGKLVLDAQQVSDLRKIHVPVLVGNWVTHYETGSGSSLSPRVLKSVLKTIDDFADCFRCNETSCSKGRSRCWYKSLAARC